LNKQPKRFPYRFEKNGRVGKIYRLGNGTLKTYFRFAGEAFQNTFQTYDAALSYLENEFLKLDCDTANSLSQNPLNGSLKEYAELEQWLRKTVPGASLREGIAFFVAHHHRKSFQPRSVAECADIFVKHQRANNISTQQIEALEKHFRRFKKDFGNQKIHEIPMLDISNWLAAQTDERNGRLWSGKTRINNLGSLVSLSLFARDALNAIPDVGKTEFQKVRRPKLDLRAEVEIHTPEEKEKLLTTALESDIDLIPALVLGGFQGLRPAEFHAEGAKRPPLRWTLSSGTTASCTSLGKRFERSQTGLFPCTRLPKLGCGHLRTAEGRFGNLRRLTSRRCSGWRRKRASGGFTMA
jgi:hypothetical protein